MSSTRDHRLFFDDRDDDYQTAHELFQTAYPLLPHDGSQPPLPALQLLRIAAMAWARHFNREHERYPKRP